MLIGPGSSTGPTMRPAEKVGSAKLPESRVGGLGAPDRIRGHEWAGRAWSGLCGTEVQAGMGPVAGPGSCWTGESAEPSGASDQANASAKSHIGTE